MNISSPNTKNLRALQSDEALDGLLGALVARREELAAEHGRRVPMFLKIAPDLTSDELAEIAEVALAAGIAGIIATNTTLSREGLQSPQRDQAGGLSGAPLFEKSTRVLAQLSRLTDGKLPLVGVGGISSADQAYAKIRAGASAVQLYSALVYQGLSLASDIALGLDQLLARDGYTSLTQAIGTGRDAWL